MRETPIGDGPDVRKCCRVAVGVRVLAYFRVSELILFGYSDCDWTPVCSEGLTASQNAPNGSYGP